MTGLLEVPGRDGLLEVVVLSAADAERAQSGGADRLHLLAGSEEDSRSPQPALVGQVRRSTTLPIRATSPSSSSRR